jgi:hypothetical protein
MRPLPQPRLQSRGQRTLDGEEARFDARTRRPGRKGRRDEERAAGVGGGGDSERTRRGEASEREISEIKNRERRRRFPTHCVQARASPPTLRKTHRLSAVITVPESA